MTNINKQRLTVFLKPAIIKHARATAVVQGKTLTKLVGDALVAYLPEEIVLKKENI